jgi:type VI secretion system protein ImpH
MKADHYSELFGLVALLDDSVADATLGGQTPIAEEPLLFRNRPSLFFPAGPARVVDEGGNQPIVDTGIFGLLGPIGALPYVYSEMVARSTRANEKAIEDFFAIFSHRSTSLMYRAWRKNRAALEHQPGAASERQRKFSAMLEGLVGATDLPERIAWLEFERNRVLSCADLFSRRVRSANGLRRALRRQFQMEFEIEEFVGNWEILPEEAKSRFGASGSNMRLGYNTIVGNRTWQVQSTFRVVVHHPSASQYRALQPGSESLRLMQLVVSLYCPPELSFRLHIVIKGNAIEAGPLGGAVGGAMLGWNSVLGGPDPERDYQLSICRNYNESRMKS